MCAWLSREATHLGFMTSERLRITDVRLVYFKTQLKENNTFIEAKYHAGCNMDRV